MSPRNLFEVAIRVLAAWIFLSAVDNIFFSVSLVVSEHMDWSSVGIQTNDFIVPQLLGQSFRLVIGILLFGYARKIANWFYLVQEDQISNEAEAESASGQRRFGPGDVYHTAIVVFGLYLLFQVVQPLCSFIVELIAYKGVYSNENVVEFIKSLVYIVAAIFLIFGAKKIATMVTGRSCDSDKIPKPQFSLALIVVLFILFAVLFGVIRLLIFSRDMD